ncbi:hypothetical protein CesoFtcFv8_023567 [Champsocephalus esox]|uniref:Uncharacterized protein n=2 Tax=Champsocephalus TaxID=52236 RepID=A0AAN8CKC7_CHAGU|nr:hypothetical protein CesoFtcFv8_023567 [Champsocephalus esox]KAK5904020.1 hypothetical protein CgunFtcFv8_007748 [Champsocephalus gunnari]
MKQSLVELQSGGLVLCGAAARPQTSSGHWMCLNHAFQELWATIEANVLPQTVQHVISANAVSRPQIAAACVCVFIHRGFHRAGLLCP